MSTPFIAQIQPFGFNFAPKGWSFCDGQTLSIAQHSALFSLIGTIYGGNGTTSFNLPDLRGRVALHQGHGPGLSERFIGEASGSETVTLTTSEMPTHNHLVMANGTSGNAFTPTNNYLAADSGNTDAIYSTSLSNPTTMASNMVGSAGGNQPHNNMQPYLVLNWCIAMQGIFPSQS